MKKLLNIIIASTIISPLSSCGKIVTVEDDSKYGKKIEETKIDIPDFKKFIGYKKIGVAGYSLSTSLQGSEIKKVINKWTYNNTSNQMGHQYNHISGKVQLVSSDFYNVGKYASAKNSYEFKTNVKILQATLIAISNIGTLTNNSKFIILPRNANSDTVFNYEFISHLYIALQGDKALTPQKLLDKIKVLKKYLGDGVSDVGKIVDSDMGATFKYLTDGASILFNAVTLAQNLPLPGIYSTYNDLITDSKTDEYIKEALTSKELGIHEKSLDALFIQVKDKVHNSEDVYKVVKEKKYFENTELVFVGEKAKFQSGTSSKTFAGPKVTTGSFNKYASAFIAGYKSAILQLKWSKEEQKWEKTNVVFLIGAISDSTAKRKAFAFRRGVEAAAAHASYSKFLKVKFVSKTIDSSKSSKKLYRDVSEWKAKDDGKSKLYEFANSDVFMDADRRVVYLAGTTARDWRGSKSNAISDKWDKNDDTGLIGALYNYKTVSASTPVFDLELSSKTFSKGINLILDNAITSNDKNDDIEVDNTKVETREIVVLGTIGTEVNGIEIFTENILRALYLKGDERRLHKHSVFGGDLLLKNK